MLYKADRKAASQDLVHKALLLQGTSAEALPQRLQDEARGLKKKEVLGPEPIPKPQKYVK